MGYLCFICSCDFKTKKKLFHHIEVALRCMYDDHLVLQQQGPIHESVPVQHLAQVTHLHYCRDVASEVAAEMGVYGQDDGMFADRPVTLDHDGQRKLERSTPPLDIPMAESRPLLTVANPAKHGSVYNPYTMSSPSNYDPPRSNMPRPKGFTARRPNDDLNEEHWSGGEDNVGGYFDGDDGDEMEMTDPINPFESSDQAADMYRKDKPHLFIEFAEDHYLLQGISNDTGAFVRGNYAIVRCIRPDAPERKDSYVCDCDLSRANQVTDMGFESMARTSEEDREDHNCVHEQTVYCARNNLFPSDVDGGPVRVSDDDYGSDIVPVYKYEDERWGGSCIRPSQGRSASFIHIYRSSVNGAMCLPKVDRHNGIAVRCQGGTHFGCKADCCRAVCDHYNRLHPGQPAGFASDQTRREAPVPVPDLEQAAQPPWPANDPEKTTFACVFDWRERDKEQIFLEDDGFIHLRPKVPDDGHWEHRLRERVTVYGLAHALKNVHVYDAVRIGAADIEMGSESSDGSEDTVEEVQLDLVEFSFQSIGIFVSRRPGRRGGDRYFDAAPLYDGTMLKNQAEVSIELVHKRWTQNYVRWSLRYPEIDHLEFVTLNEFYPVFHSFVRNSEMNRNEYMRRYDTCLICGEIPDSLTIDGTARSIFFKYLHRSFLGMTCCGNDDEIDDLNAEIPCGSLRHRKLQAKMLPLEERGEGYWTGGSPCHHCSKDHLLSLRRMADVVLKLGGGDVELTTMGGEEEASASGGGGSGSEFTEADFNSMFAEKTATGETFGTELVQLCLLFREKSPVVTKSLATLVKFAAGDSSVIATVPLIGSTILLELLEKCPSARDLPQYFNPVVRKQLSGLAGQPVIASLLHEICGHVSTLDDSIQPARTRSVQEPQLLRDCNTVLAFLHYLCDNVQLAFEPAMRQRLFTRIAEEGWSRAEGSMDVEYDPSEFLESGVFCANPGLGKHRERGRFAKDAKTSDESSTKDGGCDKPFGTGRNRTGGVFTFVCPHRIVYAFHMIPRAEGRNDAFSFFRTRFIKPPRIIVYDFSCQLMEYCLNRDPEFFATTRFFIDRYHQFNHVSCSKAHSMAGYEELKSYNSQSAEQVNAHLKKALGKTSMCNYENFMHTARFVVREHNAWCIAKVEKALELKSRANGVAAMAIMGPG